MVFRLLSGWSWTKPGHMDAPILISYFLRSSHTHRQFSSYSLHLHSSVPLYTLLPLPRISSLPPPLFSKWLIFIYLWLKHCLLQEVWIASSVGVQVGTQWTCQITHFWNCPWGWKSQRSGNVYFLKTLPLTSCFANSTVKTRTSSALWKPESCEWVRLTGRTGSSWTNDRS